MSVDCEFSGDEDFVSLDFSEPKSNYLYRYEQGGILVYDSSARLSDEPIQFHEKQASQSSSKTKKPKTKYLDYDLYQFQNIPAYSRYKQFPQDYTIVVPDSALRFSSKFECGNLKKAIMISEKEYNLFLEYDTETQGYTQWYYFSVKAIRPNHKVRFNIMNLVKFDSLYNEGMKPLTFSLKKPGIWERKCAEVSYFKNKIPRKDESRRFYTLTFSYIFEDPDDTVFFAYSYPYTYTELMKYVDGLQHSHPAYYRCNTLCHTLAGNSCPILTITHNIFTYYSWPEEQKKLDKSAAGRRMIRIRESKTADNSKKAHQEKKTIFITARVHPGESNSSYMVKGLIDFLLGPSKEASLLRKRFIFKIIPMLNPDGVIYGNYRCSLLGVDLNRRWDKPNKVMHPTIHYAKKMLEIMTEESEVLMYCDMHGHSIKKEVFMYGCHSASKEIADLKNNVFIRLIPFLLSQKSSCFSFKNSKFRIEKSKASTARVVNFTEFGVLSSFTLEASFYGCSSFDPNNDHLTIEQLENLGKDLCLVLLIFLSPREMRRKINELASKLSGKPAETKPLHSTKADEEEDISIKDAIHEINSELIEDISMEDEDSGGSDDEGSDNDDKKKLFNERNEKKVSLQEKFKNHKINASVSPLDNQNEYIIPATPKPTRFIKEMQPIKRTKFRDNRSSSVLKDKSMRVADAKPSEFTDEFLKLKSILRESPIKFTREKIPHDFSLITIQKKNNVQKKKKSQFFERRMKLQIISIIKNKLDALL